MKYAQNMTFYSHYSLKYSSTKGMGTDFSDDKYDVLSINATFC